ncbi:hypothetical protein FBY31_4555 [Arthrobacter sp. SLBN-100]|nr:hypothetical protein FBY31_4555 [Arthrobacter sp. SLBN-100]
MAAFATVSLEIPNRGTIDLIRFTLGHREPPNKRTILHCDHPPNRLERVAQFSTVTNGSLFDRHRQSIGPLSYRCTEVLADSHSS